MVKDLEATVADLVRRVAALETKVAAANTSPSASASASPTVHVHVGTTPPIGLGGGEPSSSSPPSVGEEGPPPPTPTIPTAGLDAKIKHYTVITPGPLGQAGTYRSYQKFGEAVKDPTQPWSGRSKIPWAWGAEGQSFATRREAESHYRTALGLSTDTVIPHWG